MLELVSSGLTTVIGWVGTVVSAIVGSEGQLSELAPLFMVGVSISAILLGIKIVKSVIWGA